MSAVAGVTVEDGTLVTGAEFPAPEYWTKNFETLGGNIIWGAGGEIDELLTGSGIDNSNLKPLYGMEPWMGEALSLFEAGSPSSFYIYNAIDGSLFKINAPNDLATIVDHINDDSKGFGSLDIDRIS